MKKILVLPLCVLGFILIAAPTAVEYACPVFLNGKPFANAALINGIIAVKVSDIAMAAGDTLTLEHFKLNGGTLTTVIGGTSNTIKGKGGTSPASKVREAALVPAVEKQQPQTAIKGQTNALIIVVRKAGNLSNSVFMFEGKAWVPLKDVALALGTVFNQRPDGFKSGQSIQMNVPANVNALIGLL